MGRPLPTESWEAAVAAAISQFGADVTPRLWGPESLRTNCAA
jgi:hypothetical protein